MVRGFHGRVSVAMAFNCAPALPTIALTNRCRRAMTDSQTREAFASAIAELPTDACALEDRRLAESSSRGLPRRKRACVSRQLGGAPSHRRKNSDVGVKNVWNESRTHARN